MIGQEFALEGPTETRFSPCRASTRDLRALLELKGEVVDASFVPEHPGGGTEEWKQRFVSARYFTDRLSGDPGTTIFYLLGGRQHPDGMIALKERDGAAYLGDLYVRPRGQGLGRVLLRHALDQARTRRLPMAVADIFEGNHRAFALFQSEGFREHDDYVEQSLGVTVHRLSLLLRASDDGEAFRPSSG